MNKLGLKFSNPTLQVSEFECVPMFFNVIMLLFSNSSDLGVSGLLGSPLTRKQMIQARPPLMLPINLSRSKPHLLYNNTMKYGNCV